MKLFIPEKETCPCCKAKGCCIVHSYYDRSIIDFYNGESVKASICIMRVICKSCGATHAILPDSIIPYNSYSLFFVLEVLTDYYKNNLSLPNVCQRYDISLKVLSKWIKLFKTHKSNWLGVTKDFQVSDYDFLSKLTITDNFSSFSKDFILKLSFSFLQAHKNPKGRNGETAGYHQKVFLPNYDIWQPRDQ